VDSKGLLGRADNRPNLLPDIKIVGAFSVRISVQDHLRTLLVFFGSGEYEGVVGLVFLKV
jgi:hypothetical protein